jgi:hypothetical protein
LNSVLAASFLECFARLPPEAQDLARKNYRLWKKDPAHPSLRYKLVGNKTPSYSVRIGAAWRVLGVKSGDTMIWFWIGPHAEYDRLLKSL